MLISEVEQPVICGYCKRVLDPEKEMVWILQNDVATCHDCYGKPENGYYPDGPKIERKQPKKEE